MRRRGDDRDTRRDVVLAYAPYVIIVAVLSSPSGADQEALDSVTKEIDWPGLNVVNADGEEPAPSSSSSTG